MLFSGTVLRRCSICVIFFVSVHVTSDNTRCPGPTDESRGIEQHLDKGMYVSNKTPHECLILSLLGVLLLCISCLLPDPFHLSYHKDLWMMSCHVMCTSLCQPLWSAKIHLCSKVFLYFMVTCAVMSWQQYLSKYRNLKYSEFTSSSQALIRNLCRIHIQAYCQSSSLRSKWTSWVQYLMLRLMCAGLEPLFLVPVRAEGGDGLWLAGLERALDAGWEGGGWAGVSPEGEVDGGGVHCQASESPPWASFSELKGAPWGWSVQERDERNGYWKSCKGRNTEWCYNTESIYKSAQLKMYGVSLLNMQ